MCPLCLKEKRLLYVRLLPRLVDQIQDMYMMFPSSFVILVNSSKIQSEFFNKCPNNRSTNSKSRIRYQCVSAKHVCVSPTLAAILVPRYCKKRK